ncbi:hypothetical protein [Xanthomonas campestris]|uniref:hypothetical protein n=1 Tax=Xanthomonas campestris TaxID=339 RepID=UPI0020C9F9E8|nr:hypothetical protein [Xanthomonas campestris]
MTTVIPKVSTVRLYGVLRAKFGKEFRLAVASPAEAIRALSLQLPGFQAFLMGAKDRGLTFAVFNGRRNLSEDQLHDPPGMTQSASRRCCRVQSAAAHSKRSWALCSSWLEQRSTSSRRDHWQ